MRKWVLAAALLACAAARADEWRHAEAINPQHVKAKYIAAFEKDVAAATGGRLRIKTYYSDSLYSIESGLSALATGELELMSPPMSRLTKLAPQAGALDLPFLFPTGHSELGVSADLTKRILTSLERFHITPLSSWPEGSYILVGKRGFLARPEDFRGKRIRSSGHDASEALFQALGATPVRLPISETYSALDQGVIDGILTSVSAYSSLKLYELAPYAVYWPIRGAYVLLANSEKLAALPADQRQAIAGSWDAVGRDMKSDLAGEEARLVAQMTAAGAKIRELQPAEVESMLALGGRKIQDDFARKHPDVAALLQTAKAE